jgi:RimJ/RimL family protein N-acetyltransferase
MIRRAYVPLPRQAKIPGARFNPENLAVRSPSRICKSRGWQSKIARVPRLGVPARRSPVYTITMCPIIPTHQMLSIAPNILTTQRLILRPWRETDRDGFARLNADPVVMELMPRCLSRDESDAIAARYQAGIAKRGSGFWAVEVKGADHGARRESDFSAPGVDARGASNVAAATGESGVASPDGAVVDATAPRTAFIGFVGLSVPRFVAHFTSPIAKSRLRRFLPGAPQPAYERRDFRALPCVEIGWRLSREHWGNGYASEAASACLRFGFEKLTLKQIVAFTVPLNKRSIGVMERIGMSCDPADDFDHPNLPLGDPLRRHVLYRLNRS